MASYASLLAGGRSAATPDTYVGAKKQESRHGIGGFFENLGDDIKDLGGIPAGLVGVGRAIVHDAKKPFGGSSGEYQLDNIGGAIKDDYKRLYGPAFHGEWSKFGKRLYANPLSPALDVASLFTGGATAAGKIGAKVALTTGSKTAARIAGLERYAGEITPYLAASKRGATGRAGSFVAKTHKITDPLTGNVLHEMPVSSSAVIRGRNALKEAAYSKLPSTGPAALAHFSPTVRGARLSNAAKARVAKRDAANLESEYHRAYSKLSQDERDALPVIMEGFNTVERAKARVAYRADSAVKLATEHQNAPSLEKDAAPAKGKALADVESMTAEAKLIDRVLPHIANPSERLAAALKVQQKLDDQIQAKFYDDLIRKGNTPEDAEAIIQARSTLPLREVGITPGDGERPMILTHIEDAAKRSKRHQSLEHGMVAHTLGEELATKGENFRNARYDLDATNAVTTHRLLAAKEQTHLRIERAIGAAVPFDRAKHAELVASGKLHWLKKDDRLVKDLHHVDASLDRVEKRLGMDISDVETEAIRDAYDAMYDLVMRDGSDGLVLPKAHYNELRSQFNVGGGLLRELLAKPTRVWKHIVLSWKGSYYVNNFIGNMLLGAVAYGPRYILDVAHESLPKALRGGVSKRIDADVSDLKRTAASSSVLDDAKAGRYDLISKYGEKINRNLAPLTENNFRRAAFRNELRKSVKQYQTAKPGMTRHEAIEAVFNDKQAVDHLAESTYGNMLDYSKMTPLEREYILPLLPFWSFTRAMTGRTVRLALDEPWKLRVLLYFGQSGIQANMEALPEGLDLPTYLRGMIMLDKTKELPRIFSTAGSNPFTAPMDLITELLSIGGSEGGSPNLLSSLNPFLKAPLEAGVNKDMFMGREVEAFDGSTPDGFAGRLSTQLQKQVPQLAMYQRYVHPSKYPQVQRDAGDTWLQYAGLPVGDLNPKNVQQINNYIAADKARKDAAEASRVKAVAERSR